MTPRATLLPDERRLVVDAVTCLLSVFLAALLLTTVLAPDAGETARYVALMTLYLVTAQVVQAVLGQLVLVRIRSRAVRAQATLGIWVVVLGGLAYLLPELDPGGRTGSGLLLLSVELALLAGVRGSVIGILDLDRRLPQPAEAKERADATPLG